MENMECCENSSWRNTDQQNIILAIDWKADETPESDWSGSQKAGGNTYGTDGEKTGCDGRIKGTGSDEVG